MSAVVRNMTIRSFVEGTGRRDVYEYPVEALREAIVNALVHRDYSPYSRGSAVQIAMYVDRLIITNPGGLHGTVSEDDLGADGVSSTRNSVLVKLLQDVRLPDSDRTVCENRGSGVPAMVRELRLAGSAPPEFHNRISRFTVVFAKHRLLTPEAVEWLDAIGAAALSSSQQMALVVMREGQLVTVQTLRNLGVDSRRAGVELRGLVARGLAVRIGERRHLRYVLGPAISEPAGSVGYDGTVAHDDSAGQEAAVLGALDEDREHSRLEIEHITGMSQATTGRVLNRLLAAGVIEATAPPRSPLRKYRRTAAP